MIENRRIDRLGRQLKSEISNLIDTTLDDPRVKMVSVTEVRVSPDLRYARVYVSTLDKSDGQENILAGLDSARSFLRKQLSQRLPHLKRTPDLTFAYDESVETGMRVEELIQEIRSPD